MTRPTIKDVAAQAKVAISTASRALSGNGYVSPTTREAVEAAARDLDYTPNAHAQSLRSARYGTFALLIPDIRNPYFAELAHQVEIAARAQGRTVLLGSAAESPELMLEYMEVLRRQRVDGIITAPFDSAIDALTALHEARFPLVFLDRRVETLPVPSATSDTSGAIRDALAHLHHQGVRRLGLLAGPQETSTGRERLAQALEHARALGLEPVVRHGSFVETSGHDNMLSLLEHGVDGVLAADSLMSVGAVRALHERGIRPGEDLPLVGFDAVQSLVLIHLEIPLIIQDIPGLAHAAVEQLSQELDRFGSAQDVHLPATLDLRGAGAAPTPGADHEQR